MSASTSEKCRAATYQVRSFEEDDLPTLARFALAHDRAVPPRRLLPRLGLVVEHRSVPAVLGFAYLDAAGTGIGQIGFVISNPDLPAAVRARAFLLLVDRLHAELLALGYSIAMTTVADPKLVAAFSRLGYVPEETNLTRLYKSLA